MSLDPREDSQKLISKGEATKAKNKMAVITPREKIKNTMKSPPQSATTIELVELGHDPCLQEEFSAIHPAAAFSNDTTPSRALMSK